MSEIESTEEQYNGARSYIDKIREEAGRERVLTLEDISRAAASNHTGSTSEVPGVSGDDTAQHRSPDNTDAGHNQDSGSLEQGRTRDSNRDEASNRLHETARDTGRRLSTEAAPEPTGQRDNHTDSGEDIRRDSTSDGIEEPKQRRKRIQGEVRKRRGLHALDAAPVIVAQPQELTLLDKLFGFVHLDDVLGIAEVAGEAKEVAQALRTVATTFDSIISATNKDRAEAIIWQNLTDDEYMVIAEWITRFATKSKAIATVLRKIKVVSRQINIVKVIGVKATLTWIFYAVHGGVSMPDIQSLLGGMLGGAQ